MSTKIILRDFLFLQLSAYMVSSKQSIILVKQVVWSTKAKVFKRNSERTKESECTNKWLYNLHTKNKLHSMLLVRKLKGQEFKKYSHGNKHINSNNADWRLRIFTT